MKNKMTAISEGQQVHFYMYKKQNKMRNVFIYKNPDTIGKARQLSTRFLIQKAVHFTLRDF